MLLTSPAYFVFLGLLFFIYWPLARRRYERLAIVLFANLLFYAKWDLIYLVLIPAASTADYLIGRALSRTERFALRRALVTASIAVNAGLIVSARSLLPLGLSFYAFQSLTYTIDVYRRDAEPAGSYLAYLCSSSLFPTTLAGPITRIPTLLSQFEAAPRLLAAADGGRALFVIGLGLMKKFLIADYLAEHLVNRVFDTPKQYSGAAVLIGVYGYAFQLYYDFSGYTDIAIGSALLLGLRLPQNFNRPYAAENIADFWRRWHITLSNWLRDYLYFSLPGLRSKWKVFTYTNLVITMALGGLWHGGSATFLVWGLLHGFGLAFLRMLPKQWPLPSPLRQLATFHFVAFAWIFFRAADLATARDVLSQIASGTFSLANVTASFALILAIAALAHFVPRNWYDTSVRVFALSPAYAQAAALALLVLAIQYIAATGAAPFIYTKF
jgi:D-alanyl-lipoteichoic acid acyltransferase DltB (MBOAT superfamily)